MSTESVRKYKGCLSYEQTERAWNRQKKGTAGRAVAIAFNVDVSTLYRSYQHYGFQPPKYQKRRKRK